MLAATIDRILDGIVTKLQTQLKADVGEPETPDRYLKHCARYMGELVNTDYAVGQSGIMGRCPAILVAYAGERKIRGTVGGRTSYVESTFIAMCCSDNEHGSAERKGVLAMMADVDHLIAGKSLGLDMTRLLPQAQVVVLEAPRLLAYGVRFTTRYHKQYGQEPVPDVLTHFKGELRLVGDLPGVSVNKVSS